MGVSPFRTGAAICWIVGIAGMIVSSIRGNNMGWVVSCGLLTAAASIILLAVTAATRRERIDVFEEADAERLEGDVQALIADGADEAAVRTLVRDAVRLGRGRRGHGRGSHG
jgi:hypothetical protein